MSLQPYNDLETLKEDRRRLKEKDEGGGRAKVDDSSVLYCRDTVSNFLTDSCI